jgi:hypothetical protein
MNWQRYEITYLCAIQVPEEEPHHKGWDARLITPKIHLSSIEKDRYRDDELVLGKDVTDGVPEGTVDISAHPSVVVDLMPVRLPLLHICVTISAISVFYNVYDLGDTSGAVASTASYSAPRKTSS